MPIGFSNKVILLTEVPRIKTPIKLALNESGLEFETEYPALTSLSLIRRGIDQSGKTAFIRTELLRFIKEKGFPAAFIIDCKIDLGLKPEYDPDQLKLFRTLIIAYIIISKGTECRSLKGNFILLTKGGAFEKETGYGKNPHSIMKSISSQNPEINSFIDELKNDRTRFDELFTVTLIDTEMQSNSITEAIVKILPRGGTAAAAPDEQPAKEAAVKDDGIPARVVFRIDENSVYDDGTIHDPAPEEYSTFKEKEFYIVGTWARSTELEVSKKIAAVVQKGINEKARFGYNDPVTFNIDDQCVIDKDTTLSIAQLFTKNLSLFKKIKINTSAKNGALILKSRGYPMIKNILTVAPE